MNSFEDQLKGGHPNSLGNTIAVVEEVLKDNARFAALFACYFSNDAVVRLRTSNAMKRIGKAKKLILVPYINRFLTEIAKIDQASTQWTLAQLFKLLAKEMTHLQREQATAIMKNNLAKHQDWIVLNQTMDTLTQWAKKDIALKTWITPHLEHLSKDDRKSVSGRAKKMLVSLKE